MCSGVYGRSPTFASLALVSGREAFLFAEALRRESIPCNYLYAMDAGFVAVQWSGRFLCWDVCGHVSWEGIELGVWYRGVE